MPTMRQLFQDSSLSRSCIESAPTVFSVLPCISRLLFHPRLWLRSAVCTSAPPAPLRTETGCISNAAIGTLRRSVGKFSEASASLHLIVQVLL